MLIFDWLVLLKQFQMFINLDQIQPLRYRILMFSAVMSLILFETFFLLEEMKIQFSFAAKLICKFWLQLN